MIASVRKNKHTLNSIKFKFRDKRTLAIPSDGVGESGLDPAKTRADLKFSPSDSFAYPLRDVLLNFAHLAHFSQQPTLTEKMRWKCGGEVDWRGTLRAEERKFEGLMRDVRSRRVPLKVGLVRKDDEAPKSRPKNPSTNRDGAQQRAKYRRVSEAVGRDGAR